MTRESLARYVVGCSIVLATSGIGAAATAQTADSASASALQEPPSDDQTRDIVVTAQRRGENLQDVPIAITAISGESLERASVASTLDLEIVTPGLVMVNSSANVKPFIRGVGAQGTGAGIENSVATYVDGVYLAAQNAASFGLADVERIEVIKGPQGTLFGRNSTGGVIQIVTKQPDEQLSGRADISYGNYKSSKGSLYLTGPLAPNLLASFTASAERHADGYGRDIFNGAEVNKLELDLALRGKLLWRAGPNTDVTIAGDYSRQEGYVPFAGQAPGTTTPFGGPRPGSTWDTNQDVLPSQTALSYGISARIEHNFDAVKLINITAYRRASLVHPIDGDGTPMPAIEAIVGNRDRQISQEVQLASNGSGRFQWLVGLYYFDLQSRLPTDYYVRTNSPLAFSETHIESTQNGKSHSVFGQATYEIFDGTKLTGGLRYTRETVSVLGSAYRVDPAGNRIATVFTDVGAKVRYNPLTYRISLDHRFSPDLLGYISYNRGFKSGGFTVTSPQLPGYFPERLNAYELGLKSTFFDKVVRANASIFYYDYSNIQVTAYPLAGPPRVYNGSKAEIYGLDLDLRVVATSRLSLQAGLSLLHDRFTDFPSAVIAFPRPGGGYGTAPGSAKGNRLPLVPDATVNAGIDYTMPLGSHEVIFNVTYLHSTGYYAEPDNQVRQPAYDLMNASVAFNSSQGWSLRAWSKNLTNTAVGFFNTVGSSRLAAFQAPRTFGVTLGKKF